MERNTYVYDFTKAIDVFQYAAFLWKLRRLSDPEYYGMESSEISEAARKAQDQFSRWTTSKQYTEWEPALVKIHAKMKQATGASSSQANIASEEAEGGGTRRKTGETKGNIPPTTASEGNVPPQAQAGVTRTLQMVATRATGRGRGTRGSSGNTVRGVAPRPARQGS